MKISVVIPTLNEARSIAFAIEQAWNCGADEVIVVDGGSDDLTCSIAKNSNCILAQSASGRGIQLNAGAKMATGDILLFLHADTSLESDGCDQIRNAMAKRTTMCGAFRQKIRSTKPIFRLIEYGNALRVSALGMAYGDQGIFVKRDVFNDLGSFDEVPLMEDFRFSRKLKKTHKYCLLPGPLSVSARRWEANGPLRQTVANWFTVFSHMRGIEPGVLAQRYDAER